MKLNRRHKGNKRKFFKSIHSYRGQIPGVVMGAIIGGEVGRMDSCRFIETSELDTVKFMDNRQRRTFFRRRGRKANA